VRTACVLSLAAFLLMAVFVGTDSANGFDEPIIETVQGWESSGLTSFMETMSTIGSTLYTVIIALILLSLMAFFLGHRKELVLFVAALGGSTILNNVMKPLFERDRPTIHRLVEEEGFSFPSGHAMASFTLAVITAYLLWKHVSHPVLRSALLVLAAAWFLLMGTSRIYLGVHYPSDILAGFLLSAFWVSLMILAFRGWIGRSLRESPTYEYSLRNLDR